MEYDCFSDEWLEWLRDRLCDNSSNDWIDDPGVVLRACPVCGITVDAVIAERVRAYGQPLSEDARHVCVLCGYIYRRPPVATYLMAVSRHPVRSRA